MNTTIENYAYYSALLAVVTEYAEGRGPLVKNKEMNDKLIALAKKDETLFRTLGFNKDTKCL